MYLRNIITRNDEFYIFNTCSCLLVRNGSLNKITKELFNLFIAVLNTKSFIF